MKNSVRVFAPNTIANVGCGFDIMGFALEGCGDEVEASLRDDATLKVQSIEGDDSIPYDSDRNIVTIAARAMLADLEEDRGVDFCIRKNFPAGSGLGSSASSAVAGVYSVNAILGNPCNEEQLVRYALVGEAISSVKPHADNICACLRGGFVVVRSSDPLDVFSIPYPDNLSVVVIYPEVSIHTFDATRILKKQVDLSDAIVQWGNVAGLIHGLHTGDFHLIGSSMRDVVAEPTRSMLIPHYDEVKDICLDTGSLGFSMSGSGPSMFCIIQDPDVGNRIIERTCKFYRLQGIRTRAFCSHINPRGTLLL